MPKNYLAASGVKDASRAVDAAERFGCIDFLVLSAGRYEAQPFREMQDAQ
jgi:NAD(P)-dependent dehydrogenase (short-subunit alcohol dehydrogenase family)